MRKNFIWVTAGLATALLTTPALVSSVWAQPTSSTKASTTQDYICPMHPHIHGGPGDTCPICGMKLVPAKTEAPAPIPDGENAEELQGSVQVDSALIQTIGVKHAPVQLEVFGDDIRAYGRVVPSTREENKLALRLEGWIENLSASAEGDPIKKGDHLFDLNSPQLISAQSDYLTARHLGDTDIAEAARQRLSQLGVDSQAMRLIQKQSKPLEKVPFYASASGVITNLSVRNGDYIKPGQTLLNIQDLDTVWVEASLPESALGDINEGDRVMVALPQTGKKRPGKVNYVQPVVEASSRTGQVRIELSNPDGALRPDSYVDVAFSTDSEHRLAVPAEALLHSSMGSYVLRWLGDGRFKPVMVTTGAAGNGFVEIRKGLEQGQQVVTSGQFLLDAEANLKSGMGSMAGHDHSSMEMDETRPQSPGTTPEKPMTETNHAGH